MGKTNPTFRDRVEHARENEWRAYRRTLRRDAQERFDDLWDTAEVHSMAGGALNPADVERAVWWRCFWPSRKNSMSCVSA